MVLQSRADSIFRYIMSALGTSECFFWFVVQSSSEASAVASVLQEPADKFGNDVSVINHKSRYAVYSVGSNG